MRAWILVIGLAGCAGAARAPEPTPADDGDRAAATERARGMVGEVYAAVRRGHLDSPQTLLSPEVFALGPRPADVFTSRTEAVVALTDAAERGRHRLQSLGLLAVPSPAGKSAWVADRVRIDGVPYTMTAVMAEVDELWFVVALQLARADGPGEAEPLAPLPGGADPGTEDVVQLVYGAAASPKRFPEQFARRPEVVFFGAAAKDHARGARYIERHWNKTDAASRSFVLDDDLRAGITPDGTLAWVVANADIGQDGAAQPEGISHQRLFFIYELGDEGWELVAMQEAAPARP